MDIPMIISIDDHVVEPKDLWLRYLPERFRSKAPRVERLRGGYVDGRGKPWRLSPEGEWADVWLYEGYEVPVMPGFAAAGKSLDEMASHWDPMLYDDMEPGCYEQ